MSNDVSRDAWKTKFGNSPAKMVLVMLSEAANDTGFGWPSIPYVCDRTELSLRQVQRVLQVFEEIGLITKTKTTLKSGKVVPALQITLALLGKDLGAVFRVAFLRAQGKLKEENVSETLARDVSETQENVSETQISVSETFSPHPLYGGTTIEPSGTTPLPPGGGSESCTIHPLLLNDAADEVMRACCWTDRRIRHAVIAQLKLASMLGEALPLIAARMISAWTDQAQANEDGLLKVIYGARKFIGDGKWSDSGTWHWDHQTIERKRNARVGSR